MKQFNKFLLAFMVLTSVGCDNNPPQGTNPSSAVSLNLDGAGSGGGGFADGYAMESLNIAKYSLAQIIENTSDEVFSELPEGKRREWMVNIIRNIEYRDVEESRYERPLKFNYDLKTEEIYATRHFSSRFPYGRFHTRDSREKLRILTDVQLDILHELSHFYDIGNTEKSDQNSDYWATELMRRGLDELYLCYDKNYLEDFGVDPDPVEGPKPYYGVYIHIASGMANIMGLHQLSGDTEIFEQEFKWTVDDGSFLMPWFTYDENGGEEYLWEEVYWNYIDLTRKYTEELLPTIYFPQRDGGNLKNAFARRYFIDDEKYGSFEALGVVERTEAYDQIFDRYFSVHQLMNQNISDTDESAETDASGKVTYVKEISSLKIDRKQLTAQFVTQAEYIEKQNIPADSLVESGIHEFPDQETIELECKYHQPKINIKDFQGDIRLPSPY